MNQPPDYFANASESLSREIKNLNPWLTLHGWIYLIFGVLYCLTIIGVLIGVPMIIAGTGLLKSAGEFERYLKKGDLYNLGASLVAQKQFFFTTGLLFILAVVLPFVLSLSLFLTLGFDPQVSKELDILRESIPKSIPQMPHELGKGREV